MKKILVTILLLALVPFAQVAAQQVKSSMGSAAVLRSKAKPRKHRMSEEELRATAIQAGPLRPEFDQSHRRNFPDPKTQGNRPSPGAYPWHFDITAT